MYLMSQRWESQQRKLEQGSERMEVSVPILLVYKIYYEFVAASNITMSHQWRYHSATASHSSLQDGSGIAQ